MKKDNERKLNQGGGITKSGGFEWFFSLIKPDGVNRGLVGKIISRFELKGLNLVGLKLVWPSKELIEETYVDKKDKPYFDDLVNFLSSGLIVAMVWEGENAIVAGRQLIGSKDPLKSVPGTIRGDMAHTQPQVVVHGSRTPEEAERQIKLWFFNNGKNIVYDGIIGTENLYDDNDAEEAPEDEEGK